MPSFEIRDRHESKLGNTLVKDAIHALHNAGVIRLSKAIETIEQIALDTAEGNRNSIEQGTGVAMVMNSTGFSGTA